MLIIIARPSFKPWNPDIYYSRHMWFTSLKRTHFAGTDVFDLKFNQNDNGLNGLEKIIVSNEHEKLT